jgi:hypothetical protein
MDEAQTLPDPPVDRRRDRRPRKGGRRIRDHAQLGPAFDKVLVSISDQFYALQARKGSTAQDVADGADVSRRNLFDIFKTMGDPKISTLVRLADYHDCELVIAVRPRPRLSHIPHSNGRAAADGANLLPSVATRGGRGCRGVSE